MISLAAFIAIAASTIVIAVQVAGVFKARAAGAHAIAYQQLVRETNEAQIRVAEALDRAVSEIASLRTRAESMERLLQDVG